MRVRDAAAITVAGIGVVVRVATTRARHKSQQASTRLEAFQEERPPYKVSHWYELGLEHEVHSTKPEIAFELTTNPVGKPIFDIIP